jgi:hypothetical protein
LEDVFDNYAQILGKLRAEV